MKRRLIFLPLLAALLSIGAMVAVAPPESIDHCFARWVWTTTPTGQVWQAPHIDKAIGLLDLRPIAKQAQKDGLAGWGLFVYNTSMAGTPGLFCYGGDFTATLDGTDTGTIEILLGASLDSVNIRDILWERLTVKADPFGLTGPKPIMPTSDLMMELHLGGHSLVKSVALVPEVSPEWVNIQIVLQEDYRKIRNQEKEGKVKKDKHREVLQAWKEKYKVENHELFIPDDLPKVKPLKHSTTITESWNCTDADSPSCDLTWTELDSSDWDIVSNEMELVTQGGFALRLRADADLSSDDHYAEAKVKFNATSGSQYEGVMTRKDSTTTDTQYMAFGSKGTDIFNRKAVNGTHTNLEIPAISFSQGVFYTVKSEADGSTIKAFWEGVEVSSVTDTAITGNVRTGLVGSTENSTAQRYEDFEAADLAAVAARRIIIASKVALPLP